MCAQAHTHHHRVESVVAGGTEWEPTGSSVGRKWGMRKNEVIFSSPSGGGCFQVLPDTRCSQAELTLLWPSPLWRPGSGPLAKEGLRPPEVGWACWCEVEAACGAEGTGNWGHRLDFQVTYPGTMARDGFASASSSATWPSKVISWPVLQGSLEKRRRGKHFAEYFKVL